MPNNPNETPIQSAWLDFTGSLRVLLVPLPDDRPLDQFLVFRDGVLGLVESPQFLTDLQAGWIASENEGAAGDLFLGELRAFPRAIEVAQAEEKAGTEHKGWRSRWLGRGATIVGSAKDLLDKAPNSVKIALKLLGEALELFKSH